MLIEKLLNRPIPYAVVATFVGGFGRCVASPIAERAAGMDRGPGELTARCVACSGGLSFERTAG
jgi:hypothetical protein